MANTIALANKYLPLLDEVYSTASVTSILDADPKRVSFSGANQVKVFKVSSEGLANYSRSTGFVDGDVTGVWEDLTLTQDRGRSFSVDSMDNEETLDMTFGALTGAFIRDHVVPEIDAYRFAKYASETGILAPAGANLTTAANTLTAIDTAIGALDNAGVPAEGRILFIRPDIYQLLKNSAANNRFGTMSDQALNRDFQVFDSMKLVKVPSARFYSAIDTNDGVTSGEEAGGYEAASAAVALNFMIIHPAAVLQVVKHEKPRIFSPDVNQKADAWKFDYRIYHDAFVTENKANGIYVHKAASAT